MIQNRKQLQSNRKVTGRGANLQQINQKVTKTPILKFKDIFNKEK